MQTVLEARGDHFVNQREGISILGRLYLLGCPKLNFSNAVLVARRIVHCIWILSYVEAVV
jgi:hypothetical protein